MRREGRRGRILHRLLPAVVPAVVTMVLLATVPGAAVAGAAASPGPSQTTPPAESRETLGGPPPQRLVADDPVLGGRVEVLFWPGSEGRAERTLRVLREHAHLPALPAHVPARAEVVLAPDEEEWARWTGGAVPHWGAGVAIPSRSRIVLPLFRAPWSGGVSEDRTLRHEWAHLGLHDHLEGLRIPRWFDEGYAQWSSGGWDVTAGWRLRVALARGTAPPLADLTLGWPRGRAEAELAYLLSASAVSFLVEEHGERGLEVLLERWPEEGSFEAAFRATFGVNTTRFEQRWVEHVGRRYGWILLLSQTAVLWAVLGVGLLVLFGLRRRRDRERMEKLRSEEPPEDGSWWRPFRGARPRPRPGGEGPPGAGGPGGSVDPPDSTR
jgi:hypothetical protein